MAEKNIDDVLAGLRKDLDGAKKGRLYTLIVGGVLVLVLFFVFMNLSSQIRTEINPKNIALVASHATRSAVKEGLPVIEQKFKENLPDFLAALRNALVTELIPSLRKQIEEELRGMIDQTFMHSSQTFNTAMKTAIARVKKASPGATPTSEHLAVLIADEFQKASSEGLANTPEQTLGQEFAQSKTTLANLQKRLELMTSNKPKTREEALELKFLRAWVSLLSHGEVE